MSKPQFKDSDVGIKKIRYGISAVDRTNNLLEKLWGKFKGSRSLPSSRPTCVPHTMFAGPGGCHAKDSGILMYDGTVKAAQDVRTGDLLMGPDSDAREVLELVQGIDQLFRITLPNGHSFVVDGNHLLHLTRTKNGKARQEHLVGDKVGISVREYLTKSKTFKEYHKLYQPELVSFNNENTLPIESYMLGALLGDGYFGQHSVCLTNMDPEVEEYCHQYASRNDLKVTTQVREGNKAATFYFWSFKGMNTNSLILSLKSLNLFSTKSGTKFIPNIYKTSSENSRLELLAGLLDTDGHLDYNVFEYVSKSKALAEDTAFVARSLGFMVTIAEKTITYKGEQRLYYRLHISGHTDRIPTKILRKVASPRQQRKNPLVFGFSVEEEGVGNYYGFQISGDHLYLAEDFLVHHNCGKTARVIAATDLMDCTVENGRLVKLTPDAIDTPEHLIDILMKKLSWKGYMDVNGKVDHQQGDEWPTIVDPTNPVAPTENIAVFIDEIHDLDPKILNAMLIILYGFEYQYTDKDGEFHHIYFPKFTCFGATTDLGDLPAPLRTRFVNQIEIEYYTNEEMYDIIHSMAEQRDLTIEAEAAKVLALCSQGVARLGENHIRGLYEAACFYKPENPSHLTVELVQNYIATAQYLPDGLKFRQVKILDFLHARGRTKGQWNKSGEVAICDHLGVDKALYKESLEPRLMMRGLIERGARGRALTDKGLAYLEAIKENFPEALG